MEKKDLVIIGGGPAGLSAGIYASRAAMNTVLLEQGISGGLVVSTDSIENYPGFAESISGPELMGQMESQARRFGLEIASTNVEKIVPGEKEFVVKSDDGEIAAGAVIIATGAQPRLLGVCGESEYTGRGVSYCATCDGAFFRGKRVAVVGGGDAAVEEAIFLTRFAQKVYIIHRRGELRATKVVQQRAFENEKIEFIWHSVVDEIHGADTVEAVLIKDVRTGAKTQLNVDGTFIYVGYRPSSGLVKNLVKLDEKGYIITDENMLTSFPGIFAAGDVRQKLLRQVVTAVADGAIAAVAAEKYLEG
ncbi:thioredoxin reductase (NADPH) [Desulfotomaculum arcticum]|uniref:Thioredoxin reductase n=1 Tax=Desulfotruncus arcticus DSM 17038 TaxID=1121424 RepID=A0A1I2URD0_9FIRM|nr:thioredoxin-disulfide reductase [Desulfotruncus arcticus]SFG77321.1 thioredoxin reductase (NADPH) [Desulfotomaculum arcticum] [Desulfotruncus arcticus DSM 17038]